MYYKKSTKIKYCYATPKILQNTTENTTENTADITNEQTSDQSTEASASSSAAAGLAAGAGSGSGLSNYLLLIIVLGLLMFFKNRTDLTEINNIFKNNYIYIIAGLLLYLNL